MSLMRSWCWVLAVGLFASTAAGQEAGAGTGTDDAELTRIRAMVAQADASRTQGERERALQLRAKERLERALIGIADLAGALPEHTAAAAIVGYAHMVADADHPGSDIVEPRLAALWMQKKEPHAALWEATVAARRKGAAFRDWAGWVLTGR